MPQLWISENLKVVCKSDGQVCCAGCPVWKNELESRKTNMKHIASIASGGLFPLYNTTLNENVSGMHGQLFIHYIPAMCPCKKLAANNIGHFRDSKDYHLQKELYSDGKNCNR